MAEQKICSTCKAVKPLSDFNKRAKSPDGLAYSCKECDKETARRSYQKRKLKGLHITR